MGLEIARAARVYVCVCVRAAAHTLLLSQGIALASDESSARARCSVKLSKDALASPDLLFRRF